MKVWNGSTIRHGGSVGSAALRTAKGGWIRTVVCAATVAALTACSTNPARPGSSTAPQASASVEPASPAPTYVAPVPSPSAAFMDWRELCLLSAEEIASIFGDFSKHSYTKTRDGSLDGYVECYMHDPEDTWVGIEISTWKNYEEFVSDLQRGAEQLYEIDAQKIRNMRSPEQYICSQAETRWHEPEDGEGRCWVVNGITLAYTGSGSHGWIVVKDRPYRVAQTGSNMKRQEPPFMEKILETLNEKLEG